MKILLSLSYYSPYISGLTIYAKNLAEGWVEQGHTVQVVTSQHDVKLPLQDKKAGVRITRVPITLRVGKGPIMFGLLRPLLRETRKADIVNCHLPQFEGALTALIAKCFGKKVILTYHTDLAVERTLKGIIIRYGLYTSQILAGLLADAIVTQSKDYASQSRFLTFFRRKVHAIYPPMIFPQASQKDMQVFQKRFSQKRKYTIGVVGRMAKEKGYEYLLEAIPFLQKQLGDDFVILFAGPKNPIGEEKYVRKISALMVKYKNFVHHLGVLSDEELGAYYGSLDVFVLPSINTTEAFGMVQIEALSCGTSVVVTDLPGVRIPVRITGKGQIAKIGDAADLAEKIVDVLFHKGKYSVKKEEITKEFGIQNVLQQYEKLFR